MAVVFIVVVVAMTVVVTTCMAVVVTIAVTVVVRVAMILVLPIVVPVIVPDFVVILIPVPLMFPATMSAPVGMLAAPGERTAVSEMRIVVMVDVAMKAHRAAEPWPGAIKYASAEPLWTVVAEWRALIGRVIEVAVGAHRCHSNADVDLGSRTRIGACQANECKNRHNKKPGKLHYVLLV